jgi:hypothetical protein
MVNFDEIADYCLTKTCNKRHRLIPQEKRRRCRRVFLKNNIDRGNGHNAL